jgi:Na+-transporting NADH:ubiquinone oxidoreductase subunit NqrD
MAQQTNVKDNILLRGAVIFNPVFIQLAGICIAAAASTDVITALIFFIVFTVDTVVCCFLASLLFKRLPRWLRVALYLIIGAGCIFPFAYFAEKTGISLNARMQLYLPLLAVNSVTSVHCEQFAVKNPVGKSVEDAFAVSVGFGAVMLILGIIREIFGNGTFAGLDIGLDIRLSGLLMPFGAFVILGYLAMVLKWYINKYRPEFNEKTAVKIKNTKVGLRRYEDGEQAPAAQHGGGDESITEMEFLFGNEPEEFEIFTEFWSPGVITARDIVTDMENLSKEHEQFSSETDRRVEELFTNMDSTIDFEAFEAVAPEPETQTPPQEDFFAAGFEEYEDDESEEDESSSVENESEEEGDD